MVELIIAGVLIGTIVVVAVPALRWVSLEMRAANRRQLAGLEAANVLEQITSRRWDDLTAESVGSPSLSEEAKQQLPGGELHVFVDSAAGPPEAKRVSVVLRWRERDGVAEASSRLAAWVYRQGRTE